MSVRDNRRHSGQGRWSVVFVALFALRLMSCSGAGHQAFTPSATAEAPWRFARGDVDAHGVVGDGAFVGRLDVIWERGLKEKPQGYMTLADDALVIAGSRRKIFLVNPANGETIAKFKNRSSPQSGGLLVDSLLYNSTSPPFNYLDCRNVIDGKVRWRSVILDIVAPLIVSAERLFALGGDGVVYCLNRFSGDLLWEKRVGGKMIAAPALEMRGDETLLWIVNSFGWIGAFDATSGQERFRREVDEPLVSTPALTDDGAVYFSGQGGHAFLLRRGASSQSTAAGQFDAVNPADPLGSNDVGNDVDGAVDDSIDDIVDGGADSFALTEYPLQSPSWSSPALSDTVVVFVDNSGHVYGFKAGDLTQPLWQVTLDATLVAAPIIVAGYVVVGLLDGHIYTLELATGAVVHSRLLESAIKYPPVSDGARIFVATQRKSLYCLGSLDRQ